MNRSQLIVFIINYLLMTQTSASTIIVNSTADNIIVEDGECTLREAIENANNDSDITANDCIAGNEDDSIDLTHISGTITLSSQLEISSHIDFQGPGADNLILSGGKTTRSFYLENDAIVSIEGVTITESYSQECGGGIFNEEGTLIVTDSILSKNRSEHEQIGGGICNRGGTVIITNTTLSKNRADYYGGGIYSSGGTMTLNKVTLLGNVGGFGGGLYNAAGTLIITNSTLSGNLANNGGGIFNDDQSDIGEENALTIITNSTLSKNLMAGGGGTIHNYRGVLTLMNTIIADSLIGDDCYNDGGNLTLINALIEDGSCNPPWSGDPKLAPLADNGGPSQTHALLPGSVAIDAGNDSICAADPVKGVDQRGEPRFGSSAGNHCDIGAYEYQRSQPRWEPPSGGCLVARDELRDALDELRACKTANPPGTWKTTCASQRIRFHACVDLVKKESGGICPDGDPSEQPKKEALCFD